MIPNLDELKQRLALPAPPPHLHNVGDGDFDAIGWEFLEHLVNLAHLQSHHRILDIGCGTGRLARPLSVFLGPDGLYHGFDVSLAAMEWCHREISVRNPTFTFSHHDLHHGVYNPTGATDAAVAVFPADDGSIDVACAISVFTHLPPAVMKRYLAEVARVLKPGGRFLCTAFLLDQQSRAALAKGGSRIPFQADSPGYWAEAYPDHPGAAVAVERRWLYDQAEGLGLTLYGAPLIGSWPGSVAGESFQDICVFKRRTP